MGCLLGRGSELSHYSSPTSLCVCFVSLVVEELFRCSSGHSQGKIFSILSGMFVGGGELRVFPLCHLALSLNAFSRLTGFRGFLGGSDGKESACKAGDPGLVPESGQSPRAGNWQPTPALVPENSMDRCAWGTAVHGIAKSQT